MNTLTAGDIEANKEIVRSGLVLFGRVVEKVKMQSIVEAVFVFKTGVEVR